MSETCERHEEAAFVAKPEGAGVYMALTLDEYCNPMLPQFSLDKRNNDQVLAWTDLLENKEIYESEGGAATVRDISLVVINQAWIWSLKDVLVASPIYPFSRASIPEEFPPNVQQHLWENDRKRLRCKDGGRLRAIGLALSRMIGYLDTAQSYDTSESILASFEKAIALVSEEVEKYVNVSGIEAIDTRVEKRYLHNINDVREELSMIGRVLAQQEDVFKEYASTVWPQYWDNDRDGRISIPRDEWAGFSYEIQKEWRIIQQTQPQILKLRRRIAQLDEDAERVERSIMIQLELKLKDATIKESHAAAVMGAAVLGFTIVTIIFTPLSFVIGILALPIDQLQRHLVDNPYSEGGKMYTTNYVGTIACKFLFRRISCSY